MATVTTSGRTFTITYDYGHYLGIHIVNEKQMLLVPCLAGVNCSNAIVLYDYPIDAEILGKKALELFDRMDQHNLEFKETYKEYWLVPKGVRSWKQFERSSLHLIIEDKKEKLNLSRWHVAETRGFERDTEEPTLSVSRAVSARELGEAILGIFEDMRQNPWTPPPKPERKRRRSSGTASRSTQA